MELLLQDINKQGILPLISTQEWIGILSFFVLTFFAILGFLWKIFSSMTDKLSTLSHRFGVLEVKVNDLWSNRFNYAKNQSPINLTKQGRDVATEIQVSYLIESAWKEIEHSIRMNLNQDKTSDETNPYDIQEMCFKVGRSYTQFLKSDQIQEIKSKAYQIGVPLDAFDIIFGIEIRDRFFKEKGMDINEIDNHGPQQTNI